MILAFRSISMIMTAFVAYFHSSVAYFRNAPVIFRVYLGIFVVLIVCLHFFSIEDNRLRGKGRCCSASLPLALFHYLIRLNRIPPDGALEDERDPS